MLHNNQPKSALKPFKIIPKSELKPVINTVAYNLNLEVQNLEQMIGL